MQAFTRKWLIASGLMIIGCPLGTFALMLLLKGIGCSSECGILMMIGGLLLRLVFALVFAIYLVVLIWKRARVLSLLPWAPLCGVLTLLGGASEIFSFANYWTVNFVLGVSTNVEARAMLVMLAALLMGLSCLTPAADLRVPARKWTFLAGGIALVLAIPQCLKGLGMLPWVGGGIRDLAWSITISLARAAFWLELALFAAVCAFCATLAWWVVSERQALAAQA